MASAFAGLGEYKLGNGSWSEIATVHQGLLNQASDPARLPRGRKTDVLRNIAGRVNADGTYTLYGSTSTVSDETTHDLGADPQSPTRARCNAPS